MFGDLDWPPNASRRFVSSSAELLVSNSFGIFSRFSKYRDIGSLFSVYRDKII